MDDIIVINNKTFWRQGLSAKRCTNGLANSLALGRWTIE